MIENKNTQTRYNLPLEVKYCTKCTLSNQRPRITFDAHGVCAACQYAEFKKTKIDWALREKELKELCNKYRKNDGSYDVIVPSSGGKDSAFVAYQLKYKYGMNPLTVTWSPHLWTKDGFDNFQGHIHTGGFDNILGTPNGRIHRKLTKISFEVLGDPFQPFIYGQTNYPMQMALKHNVSLIMYGENGEVEYGGNMKNAFKPNRDYKTDHKEHYFSGLAPEDLLEYGIHSNDILPYMAPENEKLEKLGLNIHFFGYYKKWIPQELYYHAVEHTGFKPRFARNEGTYSKYASFDDQIDGFHYYLAYIKFGLGRTTSDTAHEIRDGHITREEGIRLVKRFDGEFPALHFKTFLHYCDIGEEHYYDIIDSWRSPHLWEKNHGKWELKHPIFKENTQ
ncbi:N-acetyl sugar amidotransferase [bacterium]|nr:N-acetyl sugar amidotransferase [bacterium]MBU1994500.1 N-acetyl sugar amidotransferase [bacterium]